jgi:hypothetical protein
VPDEDHFPSDVATPSEYAEVLKEAVKRTRIENAWRKVGEG